MAKMELVAEQRYTISNGNICNNNLRYTNWSKEMSDNFFDKNWDISFKLEEIFENSKLWNEVLCPY